MSAQSVMPGIDSASLMGGEAGFVSSPDLGLDAQDFTDLHTSLAVVTDPRRKHGRRHTLVAIVGIAVAAVLAGARGFTAIGQWARGAPQPVLAALGVRPRGRSGVLAAPSETAIRRLLSRLDAAEVTQVLGAWLVERIDITTLEELVGLAVDGKSVRGAVDGDTGRCVHLLSAMLHEARITLAQRDVDQKTNEITQVQPLLDDISLDTDAQVVFTADALHTQRAHATYLRQDKGWHFILPVAENQPTLFAQLDALDWENTPIAHTMAARGHGRIDKRTIQVLPAPEDLAFPHVRQVALIERSRHDLRGNHISAAAVLCVTSLPADQATPAQVAHLVRGHWAIEDGSHHVRDISWREDASQVRTGSGPAVMAALRGFAIGALRAIGNYTNIAEAQRWAHSDYSHPLTILDLKI